MTERKVSSERVSEERLREIIADFSGAGKTTGAYLSQATELVSLASELFALRSSVKTVGVKKLEWSDPYPDEKPDDLYVSASQGLVYNVRKADRWNVTVSYWDSDEPSQVGSFDTLEQAKAAAQADYEQRILSAIEAPATVSEVTEDWIRDTAMNVMLATEVEEAIRILTTALKGDRS